MPVHRCMTCKICGFGCSMCKRCKCYVRVRKDEMSEEVVKTVTILKKEYEQLTADSDFLRRLRSAGVDNWEGYELAFNEED